MGPASSWIPCPTQRARRLRVTVGYEREYCKHFDKRRPLLPKMLPTPWRDEAEELTEQWADRILKELE